MKKIIVAALLLSMTGCTAWRDNTKMDDYDLCHRIGYDKFHGYNGILKNDATEVARRINNGTFTMSIQDCRTLAIAGFQNEVDFSNRVAAASAAMGAAANTMDQQQRAYTPAPPPLPVQTRCSQFYSRFGSTVNCTTY